MHYRDYAYSTSNEVIVGEGENTESLSSSALIYPEVETIQKEENIANNSLQDSVNSTVNPSESRNDEEINLITEENGSINSKISTNNLSKTSKPQINYELVVDPERKSKRYFCRYENCSYSSIYIKDLVRHSVVHTGIKPYSCKLCDKSFSRVDKLRTHELTHTGEKPHKCPHCSYAAIEKGSLVKHLRIHKDERPFKCQICEYASRNSSQLTMHLRRHTGDVPFHCTQCKMKFKMNSDLRRHMLLHSGEKPFSCTVCAFQCSQQGNLKKHMRVFHDEGILLNCKNCPFTTTTKSKFREHEWCHRNRPMRCNQCPYNASTHTALKIHQRVHSKNKPFRCEHCSYTSRQACNVRTHTKKSHPEKINDHERISNQALSFKKKVKRRECEQNSPQFCNKSFKCHMCEGAFVRKDSLDSHVRHHQNQTTQSINSHAESQPNVEPRPKLITNTKKCQNSGGSNSQTKTVLMAAINEAISDVRPIQLTVNHVPVTVPSTIMMPSDLMFRQQELQLVKMDIVYL